LELYYRIYRIILLYCIVTTKNMELVWSQVEK